jgi:hypothetical protein
MASTDWTALVVAVVGVTGTVGATWLGQHAQREQAHRQAERDEIARAEQRSDRGLEFRRQHYAALISAARVYRSALRDVARSVWAGEQFSPESMATVETARTAYREMYAVTQMVFPRRTFDVSYELNRCLAVSYQLVTRLARADDKHAAAGLVLSWSRGTARDAVALLCDVMRDELGVDEPIADLPEKLANLAASRAKYEADEDAL